MDAAFSFVANHWDAIVGIGGFLWAMVQGIPVVKTYTQGLRQSYREQVEKYHLDRMLTMAMEVTSSVYHDKVREWKAEGSGGLSLEQAKDALEMGVDRLAARVRAEGFPANRATLEALIEDAVMLWKKRAVK